MATQNARRSRVKSTNSRQTQTIPAAILFVDDDEGIRNLMGAHLEAQQFAVLTAADGLEALNLFKNNDAIRVIVTDEDMPVMTGSAMIREVRKIKPDDEGHRRERQRSRRAIQ